MPVNFENSCAINLKASRKAFLAPDVVAASPVKLSLTVASRFSLVVEKDGILSPFVFNPRRLDKPPVPVMDVIYCRSPEDFARCAPALARHLLPRAPGFLIDGARPSPLFGVSRYVEGKERRYYKGPWRPTLGDLAFTGKVIFE